MQDKEKEPLTLIFQEATIHDIPTIVAIEKKSWLSTYPNEEMGITSEDITQRFKDPHSSDEFLKECMADPHQRIFLLNVNGETRGYIHLLKENEINDLVQLYLLPEFQGQGLGSQAMQFILEECDSNKPVRLQVARYNQQAISFYEKFGFRITNLPQPEGEDWNVLPSGKKVPVVIMELVRESSS